MKNLRSLILGSILMVAPATVWAQSKLSPHPLPSLRQSAAEEVGGTSFVQNGNAGTSGTAFQTEAINIWTENFGSNPNSRGWMNYGFRGINTGNTPDTNGV
ncbi:MAG: hypothetical protein ACO3GL_06490, partial [Bacteroidia bacterium]